MKLKINKNDVFGNWIVLDFISKKDGRAIGLNGAMYLCECQCINKTKKYKSSTSLLKGKSLSCGCLRGQLIKKTSIERYGVSSAAQRPEIKEKRRQTNIARYGVNNVFQSNAVIDKIKNTNKDRYGETSYSQTIACKKRVETTNMSKYGFKSFLSQENPNRVIPITTKDQLNKTLQTKKINGSVNVLPNGKVVSEYCKEFYVNSQHANSIYREMGPEACQMYIENKSTNKTTYLEDFFMKEMSPELQLEFYNKNINIGGSTHRPDFVCPNLHINVDGLYWHSNRHQKNNMYHFNKRIAYEKGNSQLLQFRSDEIFMKMPIVKSMVLHKLNITAYKIYARKTEIKEISYKEASQFLNRCHLMGNGAKAKCLGLFFNNILVATFTYKVKNNELEILRYCTELNTAVTGGLSKLLSYIKKKITPTKIVSFVDLRYGNGSSLEKIGFVRVSVSLGWQWVDKFSKTQNRLRCRASSSKSELTTASELGLYKIYDAGQAKYELIPH